MSEFLSEAIVNNIAKSEVDGGIWLKDIPIGKIVLVQTNNTLYRIEHREDGFYIQGNHRFCATPTKTSISGSTFGGSMLKMGFIGIDMFLEFYIEGFSTLTSSRISDVKME